MYSRLVSSFGSAGAIGLLAGYSAALAGDPGSLVNDRAVIERVYYSHRTGTKPPFEETLPRATLENLVHQDLKKESALQKHYDVAISPALLDAEVQRINTSTRAPEMLVEIKAALGNNPDRFANAFARPMLVERLLREKFENDDMLHSRRRRECEQIRNTLLAARTNGASPAQLLIRFKQTSSNTVTEVVWKLAPRPAETNAPSAEELEIKKQFGPNAQLLTTFASDAKQTSYFGELPPELQQVLRVQLRQPGDVSAVIETAGGFLLYLAKEKTTEVLSVAVVSVPKQSCEQWLEEQSSSKR